MVMDHGMDHSMKLRENGAYGLPMEPSDIIDSILEL